MSAPINQILETFINGLDFSQAVISAEFDGTTTNITVDNTYHLRKMMTIAIDDIEDVTVNSVLDNIVNVTGDYSSASIIVIPTPFYFDGTPTATNVLLGSISNSADKTPMIYLFQTLLERRIKRPGSSIDYEATVKLFFLDNSLLEWTTSAHYDNVIDRMRSVLDFFEEKIFDIGNAVFESDLIEEVDIIDYPNFGQFTKDQGFKNSIFDNNFSGVEMRIKLPVLKNVECSIISLPPIPEFSPCLDNAIQFLGATYKDGGLWYQKDESGNNSPAQLTKSSVLEFNGVDNYINLGGGFINTNPKHCATFLTGSTINGGYLLVDRNLTATYIAGSYWLGSDKLFRLIYKNGGAVLQNTFFTINTDSIYKVEYYYDGIKWVLDYWENGVQGIQFTWVVDYVPNLIDSDMHLGSLRGSSNVNDITFLNITLSDINNNISEVLNFSETSGTNVYGKITKNSYNIQGTLINVWQTSDEQRPNNLFDGYDTWINDTTSEILRVLFDDNGDSIKTDGDTITGYTWKSKNLGIGEDGKGNNMSETKHLLAGGYGELSSQEVLDHPDFNTKIFCAIYYNDAIVVAISDIITYPEEPNEECKAQTIAYLNGLTL